MKKENTIATYLGIFENYTPIFFGLHACLLDPRPEILAQKFPNVAIAFKGYLMNYTVKGPKEKSH